MRDDLDRPFEPADAVRLLVALVLGVAGWTIPWNLRPHTWYDVVGFVVCLGAIGLWFSLHRAVGNLTIVARVVLGVRLATGVIPDDAVAPIGGAYYRAFGVAGVVVAATIVRVVTLPGVVSWLLRRTRPRR